MMKYANLENITTLMINNIEIDKIELRESRGIMKAAKSNFNSKSEKVCFFN